MPIKTLMKTLSTLLLLLLSTQCLQAQTDSAQKKVERSTVTLLMQEHDLYREIVETKDSSILLRIPISKGSKDSLAVYTLLSVPVDRINTITVRKMSAGKCVRNGVLIGFGAGAFIGMLAAAGTKKGDWLYAPDGVWILSTAMVCSVPGLIIGAVVGAFSQIVIPIKGSQENYKRHRSRLVEFSVENK